MLVDSRLDPVIVTRGNVYICFKGHAVLTLEVINTQRRISTLYCLLHVPRHRVACQSLSGFAHPCFVLSLEASYIMEEPPLQPPCSVNRFSFGWDASSTALLSWPWSVLQCAHRSLNFLLPRLPLSPRVASTWRTGQAKRLGSDLIWVCTSPV